MNIFLTSLNTVRCIFDAAGLRIWDVEKIFTHGGSLRVFGCHADDARQTAPAVEALYAEEVQHGLQYLETYRNFQSKANMLKDDLLNFLIEKKRSGKKSQLMAQQPKVTLCLIMLG